MTVIGAGRVLGLALCGLLSLTAMPALARSVQAGAEWQDQELISWADFDVAASADLAFSVLTDYDRMASFVPSLTSCRVLSREGATTIVEQHVVESVMFFHQEVDVRLAIVETPSTRLTIRALSGSFVSLQASYELSALASDRTRIRYRARFVPDFDLPGVLGTYVVKRSLERTMGAIAKEIHRRGSSQTMTGQSASVADEAARPKN